MSVTWLITLRGGGGGAKNTLGVRKIILKNIGGGHSPPSLPLPPKLCLWGEMLSVYNSRFPNHVPDFDKIWIDINSEMLGRISVVCS
jgi:hypothetical protein